MYLIILQRDSHGRRWYSQPGAKRFDEPCSKRERHREEVGLFTCKRPDPHGCHPDRQDQSCRLLLDGNGWPCDSNIAHHFWYAWINCLLFAVKADLLTSSDLSRLLHGIRQTDTSIAPQLWLQKCPREYLTNHTYISELHQSQFSEFGHTSVGCFWLQKHLTQSHLLAAQ